jgi:hypothetical protein
MSYRFGAVVVLALVAALMSVGAAAGQKGTGYQTGFDRWRAADGAFAGWSHHGTVLSGGAITLDPSAADTETDTFAVGVYNGGNYYTGGSYKVGTITGPNVMTAPFREAIASWNADTPTGTWIEARMQIHINGGWHEKEYILGIWAADYSTINRHSVQAQGDGTAFVAVDTLVLYKKMPDADGYRLKFRLFQAVGSTAVPTIRNISVSYSGNAPDNAGALQPGSAVNWNTLLAVPECSQDEYPGEGGEVWCSPTSTSMVLGMWGDGQGAVCTVRVHDAVAGVFDWIYDGHGNWPFNTAYAATRTTTSGPLEGYVVRFTSMAQLETWVKAGVPVVISYAWKKSQLDGVSIGSSDGHLAVVVGFDVNGNPVVNDPAEPLGDAAVQRTYNRAQLETLWLEKSGGTAYLMYPVGHAQGVLPAGS